MPEDPRFKGTSLAQLRQVAPGLEAWPRIVRTAMPRRLSGTASALRLAGLSTVVLMGAMNFVLHADFRWVLVVPATIWLVGVAVYVAADSASGAHFG